MTDLPKVSPGQVIRDITRRLSALNGAKGHKMFLSVERMASLDVEEMLQIPAFPAAIVHSLEAELQVPDGTIWDKSVGVTLVKETAAGRGEGEALEWLDDAADRLITELQEDRDYALLVGFESHDSSFKAEGSQTKIVFRTIVFSCQIDRKVS